MDILKLTVSQGMPLLIGWVLIDHFFRSKSGFCCLEKLSLAYGLGFGCVTLLMLLLSIFKISFSLMVVCMPVICAILVIILLKKRKEHSLVMSDRPFFSKSPCDSRKFDFLSLALVVFIAGNILLVFLSAMLVDIDMGIWDNWLIWGFKAKIFFFHDVIPLDMFQKFSVVYGVWDYPQHVPLMETWVMLWLGYWNDQLPRIIFPLFYTGLCIVFFYSLRRYIPIRFALAGTFYLATLKGLQTWTINAISEPVLLYYYVISFLLLCRWMKEEDNRLLVFSSLFCGLAAWTKNEGIVLFICNSFIVALFLLFGQRKAGPLLDRRFWLYLISGALIFIPWSIIKLALGLTNSVINRDRLQLHYILSHKDRVVPAVRELGLELVNFQQWNILWIMAFVFIVYTFLKSKMTGIKYYILFSIFVQFTTIILLFIVIIYPYLILYIDDTMVRLTTVPTVMALIYCSLAFE